LGRFGKIEQRIDRRDGQALRALSNFNNFVASPDLAFFEYAKVEPWAVMRHQQRWHPGIIHADANAIAGHTRLGDFKQRSANPVAIADADLTVSQSLYREVFAELPECEIVPIQFTFPIAVRLDLVDKHCALLAPVTS
jgi:hypothetical protein